MAAAPVKRDAAAEARELLAGLRRVREDSLRVAEYNTSLSLNFIRDGQQNTMDSFEWRAVQQDRMVAKMVRRGHQELLILRDAIFAQWACMMRRRAALKEVEEEDKVPQEELHELLSFRQEQYEQRWAAEIQQGLQEAEEFQKKTEEQFEVFRVRMQRIHDQGRTKRAAQASKMAVTMMYSKIFDAWHVVVPRLRIANKRSLQSVKHLAVMFEMEDRKWHVACFGAWWRYAESRVNNVNDKPQMSVIDTIKDCQMKALFTGQEGQLLVEIMHGWMNLAFTSVHQAEMLKFEEEVQDRLDKELTVSNRFPLRCVGRSVAFLAIGQVDITIFLDAWKSLHWRRTVEETTLEIQQRQVTTLERSKSLESAFGSFHSRSSTFVESRIKPLYWAYWVCACYISHRAQNVDTATQHGKSSEAIEAWGARAKELTHFSKLIKFVQMFERKRRAESRWALQTMYKNLDIQAANSTFAMRSQVRQRAHKDVLEAQAKHAVVVREKLTLEDECAEVYRFTRYRDALAKQFTRKLAALRFSDIEIWALQMWKANVAFLRTSRSFVGKDAEMSSLEEAVQSAYRAQQERHGTAALNVMRTVTVRYELVWALHVWRIGHKIVNHEFVMERENRAFAARRDAVLKENGVQMARHIESQNKRCKSAFMMKAFGESTEQLRLAFCAWKNRSMDTSSDSMSQMKKMGLMMTATNRIVRFLVPCCFRFWKLYKIVEQCEMESEAVTMQQELDKTLQDEQTQRLSHICPLISRSIDQYTVFAALQYWRRYIDECIIDKLADNAQIRWSRYEQRSQVMLRSMAQGCRELGQLTHRKFKQNLGWKIVYFALKGWQRATDMSKDELEIAIRKDSASSALESQYRFETVAHTEWMDTCIFARNEVRRQNQLHHVLGAWRWMLRSLRSEQVNARDFPKALAVCQEKEILVCTSRAQLAFAGWHGAACQARCRWIRKRCQRIRAVLGQGPGDGTPRRPRAIKTRSGTGADIAPRRTQPPVRLSMEAPAKPAPGRTTAPAGDENIFANQLNAFTFGMAK